jgi:hypothetical protein
MPASSTTPLASLNQAMGGPSDTDSRRGESASQLEKVFDWASRNGDRLDNSWDEFAPACVASASHRGDRAWFAMLETNGIRLGRSGKYDCEGWLGQLRTNATQIRDTVASAAELARRGGVYPGDIRDLRRRYRLDWDGWDR